MRIHVHVKPGKHQASITQQADGSYTVCVTTQPEQGKANSSVIELLAAHLDIPKSSITIVRGHTSRIKVVQVETSGTL